MRVEMSQTLFKKDSKIGYKAKTVLPYEGKNIERTKVIIKASELARKPDCTK